MAYKFHNISVLIVEDNQPMISLLKSVLNTFGIKNIYTSQNGKDAFELFCEVKPDLIITDWMMKPMDGITFSRLVRTSSRSPNKFTPIILMTGYSQKHRVFQARDAGVTEFLVKPFKARDLYKRIAQIIERPRKFIRSEDFFGPDRRRKSDTSYNGVMRRETDEKEAVEFIEMRPANAKTTEPKQERVKLSSFLNRAS